MGEAGTTAEGDQRRIDAECARASYRALFAAGLSSPTAGAVVAWVLVANGAPRGPLLAWWLVVLALGPPRHLLYFWLYRRPRSDDVALRMLPVYAAVMWIPALVWASLIAVSGWTRSTGDLAIILLANCGLMSSGAQSSAGTPRITGTSFVLSITPMALHLLFSGDAVMRAILGLLAIYVLGVAASLTENYRITRESVALRFENRDYLARLEVERERERAARREADAANREKSRFLAAASHDARQPLHALGLFVDALREQPLAPPARKVVSSIEVAHSALVALHDGLLDVATHDAGGVTPRIAPVRLSDVLVLVEAESAPRAKARGLGLRFRARDVVVETDASLLLRVLRNLVANAITYTRRGRVLVTARLRGDRVLVQVWDTGIGIAAEDQERIFDELFQVGNQARDREQGIGLGLAIARRLTRSLGSDVHVRSVLGRGSVFSFELPKSATRVHDAAETHDDAAARAPGHAAGALALVVDDDGLAREATAGMLGVWGYEVVAACSAGEAETYAAELEGLELVVSDLWLPDASGADLLEAIARTRPDARRILLSGDTTPGARERAQRAGVPFVPKPLRAAALRAAIDARDAGPT